MENHHPFKNISTFYEGCLFFTNYPISNMGDPINKQLWEDFKILIEQTNGHVLLNCVGFLALG
jgi:hypothetical protein